MVTKIGHRGAMGYAPENTLKSFKKALELNVDAIELDVYICKSGELVVIHDDKVNRTTNGKGYVAEKTFKELRALDAGEKEKIPELKEVFDLVNKKVNINIELKATGTAKPVYELIELYIKEKSWKYEHFLISSYNHYELREFNRLSPNIKIGALLTGIPIGFAEFAEKINASSVNLCADFINKEFIDDAHNRGLKVYVETVNDLDDIGRMKALGVDGIFSNFPDRL
ncbi:glycerophosphodiester phosphodiesterase [bacterium]|jgi:glycerophosphoryl diester phosphodiesterase|nr:glycerophosphodiester phosphodiesterase [bacterium]MBT4250730.1 glycerophosphodiester phosphodiesterase [bacterium]MBT4598187.1 glycerophosphodiester phosphodiesterase [bacterium]MBT6753785.1 glycerophosphodiester phosphodiesterase [bacterium]MBT7037502.1 glycerophosphodiester phosphodiesterase [bacterium]